MECKCLSALSHSSSHRVDLGMSIPFSHCFLIHSFHDERCKKGLCKERRIWYSYGLQTLMKTHLFFYHLSHACTKIQWKMRTIRQIKEWKEIGSVSQHPEHFCRSALQWFTLLPINQSNLLGWTHFRTENKQAKKERYGAFCITSTRLHTNLTLILSKSWE